MIDLHFHILPGLDDGVRTIEEARALARRTAEDGITAITATPHREVQLDPERLLEPVRIGALLQITAASVDGRLGREPRRASERLLELGLVHVLASDAYAPDVRETGLAAAASALGTTSSPAI
jgi:tyrosine-protein phosphatase YwqE